MGEEVLSELRNEDGNVSSDGTRPSGNERITGSDPTVPHAIPHGRIRRPSSRSDDQGVIGGDNRVVDGVVTRERTALVPRLELASDRGDAAHPSTSCRWRSASRSSAGAAPLRSSRARVTVELPRTRFITPEDDRVVGLGSTSVAAGCQVAEREARLGVVGRRVQYTLDQRRVVGGEIVLAHDGLGDLLQSVEAAPRRIA